MRLGGTRGVCGAIDSEVSGAYVVRFFCYSSRVLARCDLAVPLRQSYAWLGREQSELVPHTVVKHVAEYLHDWYEP